MIMMHVVKCCYSGNHYKHSNLILQSTYSICFVSDNIYMMIDLVHVNNEVLLLRQPLKTQQHLIPEAFSSMKHMQQLNRPLWPAEPF